MPPRTATPSCRDAYADYEARWRTARTTELNDLEVGDSDVIEEIVYHETASLPSRDEIDKLRVIYGIVDVLLWDAPWPQALAAAELAIEHCDEQAARPG